MAIIRPEQPRDIPSIHVLNQQAFEGNYEADLVDRLRAAGKMSLSLVAVQEEQVLGHILFSPVMIETRPAELRVEGLAPVAVLPDYQRQGIGSQLIREGLDACLRKGVDLVVVLGHPEYYPRFGFVRASDHGLGNEYGADDPFMVIELTPDSLSQVDGLVRFQSEFAEDGS